MNQRLQSIIGNTIAKIYVAVPKEDREGLYSERLHKNINREKTLTFPLIAFSILLSRSDISLLGSNDVYKTLLTIHITLLLLAVTFLVCNYLVRGLSHVNTAYLKVLHYMINSAVLAFCALLTGLSETSGNPPYAYTVAMFSIASMVVLSPLESVVIYLSALFANLILLLSLNKGGILHVIFFNLTLTVLALFIIRSNYSSFIKDYLHRKAILKKSQLLDEMNKITEDILQKRTEELNQTIEYEKLRTNFFANISHELKTPLTVIFSAEQMISFILKNPNANEKQLDIDQYISIIRQNCYRLIRLISNLIDITKLDAGYLKPVLSNNNIVKIVEEITLSVAKHIEFRGLNLIFDTDSEEIVIASDPNIIERIMLNLLSNAVKFTPKGGDICVNMYDSCEMVCISVKDTGIGIPQGMRQLIFEKFVQVDKTSTRTREGSGIGLSLVKSLVQLLDGTISVISEEGAGSEFIVAIPKRTVQSSEVVNDCCAIEKPNIEKINIEFSDIYS